MYSARVLQKLMQHRQYRDKKGNPSQSDRFAPSNCSSCICISNQNKSDLDRKFIKASFLKVICNENFQNLKLRKNEDKYLQNRYAKRLKSQRTLNP